MKKIKELAPKISDAVQAMIDGLREQDARTDFTVYMSSFGSYKNEVCFGCAATCTIQKLTGIEFKSEDIEGINNRAHFLEIDQDELDDFEDRIDDFRRGNVFPLLLHYLGSEQAFGNLPIDLQVNQGWYLHSNDWKEKLPMIEEYVTKLRTAGL